MEYDIPCLRAQGVDEASLQEVSEFASNFFLVREEGNQVIITTRESVQEFIINGDFLYIKYDFIIFSYCQEGDVLYSKFIRDNNL